MTGLNANEEIEAIVRRIIEFTDQILADAPSRGVVARAGLAVILASLAKSARDEALIAPLRAYAAELEHGRASADDEARSPVGLRLTPSRRGS